jgi:hypothetical protein
MQLLSIPVSRFCCSFSFVVAAALAAQPRSLVPLPLFVSSRFLCEMHHRRYFFGVEMLSFIHFRLAVSSAPLSRCQCDNFPSRCILSAIVIGSVNVNVIDSRLVAFAASSLSSASMSAWPNPVTPLLQHRRRRQYRCQRDRLPSA